MEVLALKLPLIKPGDSVSKAVLKALKDSGRWIEDGDVVVVTEKIVAKAQGRLVALDTVKPSRKAVELARATGKDARIVELILRESRDVLRTGLNLLIVETRQGFVCANAGIDSSNVEEGLVKLHPLDPDGAAEEIRLEIERETGRKVGVVISDSFGRPFRLGSVGVAIGASGVRALWDRRGERDLYDRRLKSTFVAVADLLASAASLVTGEAGEGLPAALIRGLNVLGEGSAKELIRDRSLDLFR